MCIRDRGNHWHHTKNEKFLVVKGEGIIRFRRLNTEAVYEYRVSGDVYKRQASIGLS